MKSALLISIVLFYFCFCSAKVVKPTVYVPKPAGHNQQHDKDMYINILHPTGEEHVETRTFECNNRDNDDTNQRETDSPYFVKGANFPYFVEISLSGLTENTFDVYVSLIDKHTNGSILNHSLLYDKYIEIETHHDDQHPIVHYRTIHGKFTWSYSFIADIVLAIPKDQITLTMQIRKIDAGDLAFPPIETYDCKTIDM